MIEHSLSKHTSNESLFNFVKKEYSDALKLSGYNQYLKYMKNESKNIRKRKCIWFYPPFCRSVRTKIGKKMFEIIHKHFNIKSKFYKIINKNNVKLSCMVNIANIIRNHNKKIMKAKCKKLDDSCNCRKKENYPMKGGKCRRTNVIYKANILTDNNINTFIG